MTADLVLRNVPVSVAGLTAAVGRRALLRPRRCVSPFFTKLLILSHQNSQERMGELADRQTHLSSVEKGVEPVFALIIGRATKFLYM